ncbi:hypothetical protein ACIGBH_22745 [Streptomyces sp. NPDC085929]|uniref:hypothetical protein n=1 Tax=Streptomyces sp. NPDC085929 TaxID=3365739 RepID=UPI0037CE8F82
MNHWIHGPLAWIHGQLPHDEETNVVFFRGMSLDTLTRGLLGLHRRPLAYGKGADWGLMMHDMLSWDHGDYGDTDYGRVCPPGGELAVFITDPCSAKAHAPWSARSHNTAQRASRNGSCRPSQVASPFLSSISHDLRTVKTPARDLTSR